MQEEQALEQQAPPSTAKDSSPSNEARTAEEDNVFSMQAMPACDVQAAPQQVTTSHGADAPPAAIEPMQALDMATPPAPAARQPPRLFLDLFAGIHSPLTNAMLSKGLDCFGPFDFAVHKTHDILDDRVLHCSASRTQV